MPAGGPGSRASLLDERGPHLSKNELLDWVRQTGLRPPRLYDLQMPHNNFSGLRGRVSSVSCWHGHSGCRSFGVPSSAGVPPLSEPSARRLVRAGRRVLVRAGRRVAVRGRAGGFARRVVPHRRTSAGSRFVVRGAEPRPYRRRPVADRPRGRTGAASCGRADRPGRRRDLLAAAGSSHLIATGALPHLRAWQGHPHHDPRLAILGVHSPLKTGRGSWTAPLDARRLAPGDDAATIPAGL